MSVDDDYDDDEEEGGAAVGEPDPTLAAGKPGIRNWLQGRRGWVAIAILAFLQGIFAIIMLTLRTNAKSAVEVQTQQIKDLAVEMLGHEVEIKQIYQLLPAPGGKRMTIGLDIVLVLGQLPEERVQGVPKPSPEEFELFKAAIRDMEPRIRSRVNSFLQRVPKENYGRLEVLASLKEDVKNYINDSLDGLNFGKGLRKGISKRRVTDVLLPTFVWQPI